VYFILFIAVQISYKRIATSEIRRDSYVYWVLGVCSRFNETKAVSRDTGHTTSRLVSSVGISSGRTEEKRRRAKWGGKNHFPGRCHRRGECRCLRSHILRLSVLGRKQFLIFLKLISPSRERCG